MGLLDLRMLCVHGILLWGWVVVRGRAWSWILLMLTDRRLVTLRGMLRILTLLWLRPSVGGNWCGLYLRFRSGLCVVDAVDIV